MSIPLEIWAEVLSNLPTSDLEQNASLVCSEWHDLIENFVWKRRAQKFFHQWLPMLSEIPCDDHWLCQACDNPLIADPKETKFTGLARYHRPVKYHKSGNLKRIGITYVGEFVDGVFHGFGILLTTAPDFDFYSGQWKHDHQDGQGKYSWKNGQSFYIGESKKGKRDGFGEYQWDEHRKYVGFHKDDQLWGEGTFTHKLGRITGNWRANRQHGHCIIVGGPDNSTWKFEGRYENGQRMEGTYSWLTS